MRYIYLILLTLFAFPQTRGNEPLSIEQFDKLTDPAERARAIDQSPQDQKEMLKRRENIHRYLLQRCGGEEGLKRAREQQVIRARGLEFLELVFDSQLNILEGYIGAVITEGENGGMTHEELVHKEIEFQKQESVLRNRVNTVHTLVFNLAPSPAAFELEKGALKLEGQLTKRQTQDAATPHQPPITKEERLEADKQLDEIYAELQKLPKLTPEQAQKELDACTEDKLHVGTGI